VYSQAAQLRRVSFSTIIPILLLPVNLALSAFLCASPVKTGLAAKSLQRKDACRQLVELQEAILTDAGRLGVLPRDRVREHISTHAQSFLPILSYYDVIQGYSIDGIIPLMNGIQTFASYEHGTIRNIPFEASELGVVCKHAYQQSPAVFLTNSDVLPASARLGLIPEKVTCLPHAFDDQKLRAFQKIHYSKKMGSTKVGPALFFSPTRHHWKHGDTSWKKGNDIFLRAAAHLVGEGVSLKIQLVEWGEEVEESRALIDELELSSYVEWLPTMRKEELWHRYCQAHAVVDQFAIPALGGVGFETMAFGRRLITAIDAEQTKAFFGEAPPCLCAQTTDECASRLREVALDLGDVAGKGKAAQEWIESYHSAERIVGLQVEAYKRMLEPLLT
jgi:glycosyltransferase involved in cell wall biosynthesis